MAAPEPVRYPICMATAWNLRPTWTALGTLGLGGVCVTALDTATVGSGGLAIPGVALLVALIVGLPVARAETKIRRDGASPLHVANSSLSETLIAVVIGAAAGPAIGMLGWTGLVIAGLAWLAVATLHLDLVRLLAIGFGALAVVASVGATGWSLVEGPGYSLLQPWWSGWNSWLGLAVTLGLLWPLAGLNALSNDTRRASVAALGAGALATLAVCLRLAAPWEQGAFTLSDPWLPLLLATWLPAGLAAARSTWRAPRTTTAIGLVATLLFAGPAADALPMWWKVILPLALGAALLLRAVLATGRARIVLFLGALVALAVPAMSWPSLPGPLAVGLACLIPVVLVWTVGTRALLARRT
ncbi:MAG: hypothetical protein ACI9MC_000764 [Kiritimatiellia bacterium]|jgi:hypothetical protein